MTGGRWSGTAQAYADTFAHLCAGVLPPLLDLLDTRPGDLVLDAGAGTGNATAALAGAGGRVVSADPDPEMIAVLQARGGPTIRAGLPQLPLPDGAMDRSLASFVVNHLRDPRAGVRELARVSRRRVAAAIWPTAPGPRAALLAGTFERAGVAIPAGERLPPTLDFDRSPEGLASLFSGAGLREVVTGQVAWTWSVEAGRLWSGVTSGLGVHGRVFLAQPEAVRATLTSAYADLTRASPLLQLRESAVVAAGAAR